MKFLIIILCVVVELVGRLDAVRAVPLGLLENYEASLQKRCKNWPPWNGPLGVLMAMIIPLFAVWVVFWIFSWVFFKFVLTILFLLLSLGPKDLGSQIETYHAALAINDAAAVDSAAREIVDIPAHEEYAPDTKEVNRTVLVQANERVVAVLFWFLVLGPLGALAYRIASEFCSGAAERGSGFVDAANDLRRIMAWVPSRLLALGYAVAGSMVHSLEAWRITETLGFEDNETVLERAGLGALYRADDVETRMEKDSADEVADIRGLVNRTYFFLLTMLALLVLLS